MRAKVHRPVIFHTIYFVFDVMCSHSKCRHSSTGLLTTSMSRRVWLLYFDPCGWFHWYQASVWWRCHSVALSRAVWWPADRLVTPSPRPVPVDRNGHTAIGAATLKLYNLFWHVIESGTRVIRGWICISNTKTHRHKHAEGMRANTGYTDISHTSSASVRNQIAQHSIRQPATTFSNWIWICTRSLRIQCALPVHVRTYAIRYCMDSYRDIPPFHWSVIRCMRSIGALLCVRGGVRLSTKSLCTVIESGTEICSWNSIPFLQTECLCTHIAHVSAGTRTHIPLQSVPWFTWYVRTSLVNVSDLCTLMVMSAPYRFSPVVERQRSMSITWRRIRSTNLCRTPSSTSPFGLNKRGSCKTNIALCQHWKRTSQVLR